MASESSQVFKEIIFALFDKIPYVPPHQQTNGNQELATKDEVAKLSAEVKLLSVKCEEKSAMEKEHVRVLSEISSSLKLLISQQSLGSAGNNANANENASTKAPIYNQAANNRADSCFARATNNLVEKDDWFDEFDGHVGEQEEMSDAPAHDLGGFASKPRELGSFGWRGGGFRRGRGGVLGGDPSPSQGQEGGWRGAFGSNDESIVGFGSSDRGRGAFGNRGGFGIDGSIGRGRGSVFGGRGGRGTGIFGGRGGRGAGIFGDHGTDEGIGGARVVFR